MLVQCMQDQAHPQVGAQTRPTPPPTVAVCVLQNVSPSSPQIQNLAARAAAAFVLSNEGNTALLKHFADLLPGILQV